LFVLGSLVLLGSEASGLIILPALNDANFGILYIKSNGK